MKRPPLAPDSFMVEGKRGTQAGLCGDDIAEEILAAGDGPLPGHAICSLATALWYLLQHNPDALPVVHATLAVLERINSVDDSRDVNARDKPDVLWETLGFMKAEGRRFENRDQIIGMMVAMLEKHYLVGWHDKEATVAARKEVSEFTGMDYREVGKKHRDNKPERTMPMSDMASMKELYEQFK